MDFVHYLILIAGGIGGGFVNVMIGGGGLIILPVYMGAGLPAPVANGTNRVNLVMQYIIALIKYSRSGKMPWRLLSVIVVPTAIGTIGGAFLARNMSNLFMHILLLSIIILSIVYISFNMDIKKTCPCDATVPERKMDWFTWLLFLIAGLYAGFISVAIGMIWYAVCSWRLKLGYVKITAIRIALGLVISVIALIVFTINKKVNFVDGLVLGIGSSIGAYIAAGLTLKLSKRFIRNMVITILSAAGIYIILFQIIHI